MSIHFAAARSAATAPATTLKARALVASARARVANDNVDFSRRAGQNELVLRAALKHFATHGMGAAKVARAQAEKAFFQGDRETYDWWLQITRTLDRRLAASVSGENDRTRNGPRP